MGNKARDVSYWLVGFLMTNTTIIGPNAYLPVKLYTISYSTEFVRGAKREIRDDYGNLLYSSRQMRTHIGGTYTKEQSEAIIYDMNKQGIKNAKMKETKLNLPSKCPRCKQQGSPSIYKGKGTYRLHDKEKQINRDELRLQYNHSKTKPKTCYIGIVVLDSPITQIKLQSKLKIDSLGFHRRVGTYPLQ